MRSHKAAGSSEEGALSLWLTKKERKKVDDWGAAFLIIFLNVSIITSNTADWWSESNRDTSDTHSCSVTSILSIRIALVLFTKNVFISHKTCATLFRVQLTIYHRQLLISQRVKASLCACTWGNNRFQSDKSALFSQWRTLPREKQTKPTSSEGRVIYPSLAWTQSKPTEMDAQSVSVSTVVEPGRHNWPAHPSNGRNWEALQGKTNWLNAN